MMFIEVRNERISVQMTDGSLYMIYEMTLQMYTVCLGPCQIAVPFYKVEMK
jgi:hypothetical protein